MTFVVSTKLDEREYTNNLYTSQPQIALQNIDSEINTENEHKYLIFIFTYKHQQPKKESKLPENSYHSDNCA